MKKLLLFFIIICVASYNYAAETGYQIVTEEWAPYNYLENGLLRGISTEIIAKIMEITHDKFPITLLPSMRATLELNTKPRTIMYSLFRTQDRETKYKWVGPILEESIYPYCLKKSSISATTMVELKTLERISTRFAGTIPNRMRELGFRNIDASAPGSKELFKMLLLKRSDVIVGDTDLGTRYYSKILKFDYKDLTKIPVEIFHSELYIAFSPDSEDRVVNSWSKAFNFLKSTGVLQNIIEKYQ